MQLKHTCLLVLYFLFLETNLQAQTFTNYTSAEGLIHNNVKCLAIDDADHIWFGTQEGVSKFDGVSTWTHFNTANGATLVDDNILAIAFDKEGNLWIGTDFGVSQYDGSTWTNYTEADGLADNRIKYIKADLDNNIWFGNNDGVSVFDGTNWTSYTMADGLPFGGVSFIEIAANGDKYFGTSLGGVYVFDGNTFTAITEADGLLTDNISSIAIDAQNNKWIGTADGISVLNAADEVVEHHTRIFSIPEPDTLNPIEDVQIDSKGNIWVGVYIDYLVTEGGVSMYNGMEWLDYDVSDGLVGPVVRRLAIDSKDNVWVATSTGVSKIGDIPSGLEQLYKATDFELYPNPTSGDISVYFIKDAILKHKKIEVYNVTGQRIKSYELLFQETSQKLDLNDLKAGIYFVKIGQQIARIVVI